MSSQGHLECKVLVRWYRVQVRSPAGSNLANAALILLQQLRTADLMLMLCATHATRTEAAAPLPMT